MANNRFQTLSFTQVEKLHAVIEERRFIHSRNKAALPTSLDFSLQSFIVILRDRICTYGIHIEEIRLNGGAASYVLGDDTVPTFNDLDIIFKVNVASEADFELIRIAVLDCLREYLSDIDPSRVNENSLTGAYVDKMIKIWKDRDRWSLISLGLRPNNLELKFVCQMVREYQFSVDSFQIMLDPLLTFYSISSKPISEHFFPTIVAESVYGSFADAFNHLKHKLIATCSPENIRGGGLLRYCDLLVKGYRPVDEDSFIKKEQYMCTRFFIDFMDVAEQDRQISGYLLNHFSPTDPRKYDYLKLLEMIIDRSAICLMNQERQYALNVISRLAYNELRLREAILHPVYIPFPPQIAGYYYPPHLRPLNSPYTSGTNTAMSMAHSNHNGHSLHKHNKRYRGSYPHNYPPRQAQQMQQQQQAKRPNSIFHCPPNAAFIHGGANCQRCLGQLTTDVCENTSPASVCYWPLWISPNRMCPPSSLFVIAGTPVNMTSPSSVGSSASSVASSSLGSNGYGTRATPSPLTTPGESLVPGSNASSVEFDDDDVEADIEALNGEIINNCVLDSNDLTVADDDQLLPSPSLELMTMITSETVQKSSAKLRHNGNRSLNQHMADNVEETV